MSESLKKFIYLVQGQARLVKNYLHLADRDGCDAIFLTYDEELAGAVYFPDSTWAQGRNKLLEIALQNGRFEYYIFCDDDVLFEAEGWDQLEASLLKLRPAVAVPVFMQKTRHTPLRQLKYQSFLINDECLMAFSNDVIKDGLLLPYQVLFDHVHWWASCEIQEILIQNFYATHAIQLNTIKVINECVTRYPNPDAGRSEFRGIVREWLCKEFAGPIIDICGSREKIRIMLRTLNYYLARLVQREKVMHSVSYKKASKKLKADSVLLKQYLRHNQ